MGMKTVYCILILWWKGMVVLLVNAVFVELLCYFFRKVSLLSVKQLSSGASSHHNWVKNPIWVVGGLASEHEVWFLSHRIYWNKSSSMSSVSSAAVKMSVRHSPERSPYLMTASTRCRSVAVVKPHQVLARTTCVSLTMTTLRKTIASWHMPLVRRNCFQHPALTVP